MEKITYLDVYNLMTQTAEYVNGDSDNPQLEFNLLAPIYIKGLGNEIVAVDTKGQCLVKTPLGSSWVNYAMLNDDIIAFLYKAVCDLWDSEVEKSKMYSIKEKFNELFESQFADMFEFSTDGALQHILGRDKSVELLKVTSFETLANKYLDACDIIAKMRTFMTNL